MEVQIKKFTAETKIGTTDKHGWGSFVNSLSLMGALTE